MNAMTMNSIDRDQIEAALIKARLERAKAIRRAFRRLIGRPRA